MHVASCSRVLAVALAVALTGCDKTNQMPTGVRARSAPLALRTPNAHSASIRQRVADHRRRGLSADERTLVASLSGKWKWVGDLHHQAMQQAIHDPALHGLKGQHSVAERCAVALDYAKKFAPAAERRAGGSLATSPAMEASLKAGLAQEGLCESGPRQASIFASRPAKARQLADGYGDYLTALLADLQTAKDLGDANEIMDHYVAAAAADAELGATGAALVSGTIDLARSSAQEWDDFARPREGSMFLWGWLSAVGDWIVDVVTSDIYGCATGVGFEFAVSEDVGYAGSVGDFLEETAGACAVFGISSSVGAAF